MERRLRLIGSDAGGVHADSFHAADFARLGKSAANLNLILSFLPKPARIKSGVTGVSEDSRAKSPKTSTSTASATFSADKAAALALTPVFT